jgi:stage II sporulation protein GA (sporulation sigma-E factor processing peptidase)
MICNKFKFNKLLIRFIISFYAISFIFAGAMLCIWSAFKPQKMSVNNGVVYFNVSPLLLIALSLVFYILITVLKRFNKNDISNADRVEVSLYFDNKITEAKAMVDTGFDLNNVLSDSIAVIIDKTIACELFGSEVTVALVELKTPEATEFYDRIRVINIKTVSGSVLMSGIRIDKIKIGDLKEIYNPIALISNEDLNYDFSVILPADIF